MKKVMGGGLGRTSYDSPRPARRALVLGSVASAAMAAASALGVKPAAAQQSGAGDAAYPTRPIRVVVPFAAGSATDVMMRQLATRMQQTLGQPLVIDNRAGAAGIIGSELAARAAPDGYTLLMAAVSSHSIAAAIRPKLPYNVLRDFTPISRAGTSANFIVVHPSVPARNLKELVAYSKTVQKSIGFGSGGVGSSNHLAGELLRLRTGANIVHVPYSNVAQAISDVVAGHIPMMIYTVALMPYIRDGRLRALAATSEARQKQAPDVPTAVEQGIPGMVANSWFGMFGPAGLPQPIRDRVYAALRDALLAPDIAPKLIDMGLEPAPLAPAEFRAFIERDIAMWTEVVKASGITIE